MLFEAGPWVDPARPVAVPHVPVRQNARQQVEASVQRTLHAEIPPEQQILGTPHGVWTAVCVFSSFSLFFV